MFKLEDLFAETTAYQEWLTATRHWLHQHPELQYAEYNTSRKIKEELSKMEVKFTSNCGKPPAGHPAIDRCPPDESLGTGVLAEVGTGSAPYVIIRADIDALPVTENSGVDYPSLFPGVMHACGHDGHTTILLGVAKLLKKFETQIEGTVKLIFQPAEEGGAGAARVIEEGCLATDVPPVGIFGLHVNPLAPTGVIMGRPGPLLASSQTFYIALSGPGGHASMPFLTKDTMAASSAITMNINSFMSRAVSVTEPDFTGVVSITTTNTGGQHNVIPNNVSMSGTIRTLSTKMMNFLRMKIQQIVNNTAAIYDVKADMTFEELSYPVTSNNEELYEWAKSVSKSKVLVTGGLKDCNPIMGSEDFSFYAQLGKTAFFFLGVGIPGKPSGGLHSDKFFMDDKAMPLGSAFLGYLALKRIAASKEPM